MEFKYLDVPQRSPEWFKLRLGKVTASRLENFLARSKKDGTTPLKECLDYMRELEFERTFNTSFEVFVTSAMEDGNIFEDFARRQYELNTNRTVQICGCWYNDKFVASPDGLVGDDGTIEIKLLKDNSFTEVLTEGVPAKHWKQIQGGLWTSGRKWCDYIAVNLNSKKISIIRVMADPKFHAELEEALNSPIEVSKFKTSILFNIVGEIPSREELGLKFNNNTPEGDISW